MRWSHVALVLVALSCAGNEPTATGPPPVDWGYDVCARCGMAVSDPQHAAVARQTGGAEARFDDPGCLAAWLAERSEDEWTAWVGDAGGAGWVPAGEAWVIQAPSRLTPMGSGRLAFARREDAEKAARVHAVAPPTEPGLSQPPG